MVDGIKKTGTNLGYSVEIGEYITNVYGLLEEEDKKDLIAIGLGNTVGVVYKITRSDDDSDDGFGSFCFHWFAEAHISDTKDELELRKEKEKVVDYSERKVQMIPRKIGWEICKLFTAAVFGEILEKGETKTTKDILPKKPHDALKSLAENGVPNVDILEKVKILNVFFGVPDHWKAEPDLLIHAHALEGRIEGKSLEEIL